MANVAIRTIMATTATRLVLGLASAALLGSAALILPGCWVATAVGGMAESYKRSSTRAVAAEYEGLSGKSFGVIVTGDRVLQGQHPTLFPRLMSRVVDRLVDPANAVGATGVVPPITMMEFQLTSPDWIAWSYPRLSEHLGVERLLVIEVLEYRLNEAGNSYLWDGVAIARVGVVESDGPTPTEFSFSKTVQVPFPSESGLGPADISESQVRAGLEQRLVDRVSWLFYKHQEPYYPEY
jgi:hypothetical protein